MTVKKLRVVGEWGGASMLNLKGRVFRVTRETKCYYFVTFKFPGRDVEHKINKKTMEDSPYDPWSCRKWELVDEVKP